MSEAWMAPTLDLGPSLRAITQLQCKLQADPLVSVCVCVMYEWGGGWGCMFVDVSMWVCVFTWVSGVCLGVCGCVGVRVSRGCVREFLFVDIPYSLLCLHILHINLHTHMRATFLRHTLIWNRAL
jgi:hypothetical protein